MTSRHWCGTSYDLETFAWPDTFDGHLTYFIGQLEECPTTGLVHIQFYCEFDSPVRRSHVKRILASPSAHLEPRMGSGQEAADYCRKLPCLAPPYSLGMQGRRPVFFSDSRWPYGTQLFV